MILAYHRIAEPRVDPQLLCCSPRHFEEHLNLLRKRIVPLSEVGGGGVALTFDDGYADNLHAAAPLLKKYGVTATVFVTAGTVGARREFWWDALERRHRIGPGWNVLEPRGRHAAYLRDHARLKPLSEARRRKHLPAMRPREGRRPLRRAELRELSRIVEIGSHTMTHPVLSRLTSRQRRWEFVESRRRLEAWTGRPVRSLAYPFGGPADVADAAADARAAGYARACANVPGPLTPRTDPFLLPRLLVRDWSAEELDARL